MKTCTNSIICVECFMGWDHIIFGGFLLGLALFASHVFLDFLARYPAELCCDFELYQGGVFMRL